MKAILVIDMPDSCSQCEYLGEATSDENIKACTLSQLFFHKDFDIESGREVICPLKPMPEQKAEEYNKVLDYSDGDFARGWNACIEEISQ